MMDRGKSKVELEYQLRLTKKILERIIALNTDLVTPDETEIDKIERELKSDLEKEYPAYRIQSKS